MIFIYKSIFLLILTAILPAFAWTNWHPIASINVGAGFSNDAGQSKNFPILNPITDEFYNYDSDHSTQTVGLFGGFLGLEHEIKTNLSIQVGLDYTQSSPFTAKGSFVQGADVASQDTFSYDYSIITRQILAEGKLLYTTHQFFHPYVTLGLGSSFNKAYNYRTDVPSNLTLTRMYTNNSSTSFSYMAGLGMEVDVHPHTRLGLSYRFTNLGKTQLGKANIGGVPVSGTLSQSNFYDNEILLNLIYFIT